MRNRVKITKLTERELEVLKYTGEGLTNKEIAEILEITHHTIKAHLSAILHKIDCKNRMEAVIYAVRMGWINLGPN